MTHARLDASQLRFLLSHVIIRFLQLSFDTMRQISQIVHLLSAMTSVCAK